MSYEDLKLTRKKILEVSHRQKSGHIASSFSILETLMVLYQDVLKDDDEFILSKGHAALGFYAILNRIGKITDAEIENFASFDSCLGGHPDRNKVKEAYASAGSLGHGLPIAVGVALSKKIQGKNGNVFCLVGDGECNEGTIWESALLASHLNLDNLVCIVDNNKSQTRSVITSRIFEKFSSFGWSTSEVDGHDIDNLRTSLSTQNRKQPTCVITNTIKGFGVAKIQSDPFTWHHKSPNKQELDEMLIELEK